MNILQEAKDLVNDARRADYGDLTESFDRIAGLWSAYLGIEVDSLDVGKMMILLKVSRAKHNDHRDSYVDIAGYVACIDELIQKRDGYI